MTPLRQRLIDDLTLRGYAQRTIETYVAVVARLSRFFHVPPDRLTEEQLRTWLVQMTKTRSAASVAQALCALKFFYEQTLGRKWTTLELARPPRDAKLPTVLSRAEVARVLAAIRMPTYRVCATTIYTCRLRLLEAVSLRVGDVDGARRPAVPDRRIESNCRFSIRLRVSRIRTALGGTHPQSLEQA